MAEKTSAYEVLGLKEDATKEEIVKRYNILLKKYKSRKNESTEGGISIEDVNRSYNELMGFDSGEKVSEGKEKKLSNFLYYYKVHIIVGILALFVVIGMIKTFTGYIEPDIKIALVGNFSFQGVSSLESQIYGNMKGIKKAGIDPIIYWDKKNAGVYSAMEVKLATLVLKGDEDIYLLDKSKYDFLLEKGVLKSLDNMLPGNADLRSRECRAKSRKDPNEHTYGYDVSDSRVVKNLILPGDKMILALGLNGKNQDNTLKLMRILLGIS